MVTTVDTGPTDTRNHVHLTLKYVSAMGNKYTADMAISRLVWEQAVSRQAVVENAAWSMLDRLDRAIQEQGDE